MQVAQTGESLEQRINRLERLVADLIERQNGDEEVLVRSALHLVVAGSNRPGSTNDGSSIV